MPVYLTFVTLACTLATAIVLRLRWSRISVRHRVLLQIFAAVLLLPSLLTFLTKWDVLNHRVSDAEAWIRLVACQFAIVFFTMLRPRAITTAIAAILLPFSFSTSVAGPLSSLFRSERFSTQPIADGYMLETVPWHSGGGGNSGVDFSLIYRPAHLPGVRRGIVGTRFYSTQCDTEAVYATLKPATHALEVYCPRLAPPAPLAALSGSHDHYLIPPGALSPALRRAEHK